jgi:hypothetical protein
MATEKDDAQLERSGIIDWLRDGKTRNVDSSETKAFAESPIDVNQKPRPEEVELVNSKDLIEAEGLISQIYINIQQTWRHIIEKYASCSNNDIDLPNLRSARNESGRLNIWGDGFEVSRGD